MCSTKWTKDFIQATIVGWNKYNNFSIITWHKQIHILRCEMRHEISLEVTTVSVSFKIMHVANIEASSPHLEQHWYPVRNYLLFIPSAGTSFSLLIWVWHLKIRKKWEAEDSLVHSCWCKQNASISNGILIFDSLTEVWSVKIHISWQASENVAV